MILIRNEKTRAVLRLALPLGAIPLTVAMGTLLPGRMHLAVSLCVAALSVGVFLTGIERRVQGQRRLVLAAILIALCIVGRFIPLAKPVMALTVLSGVYLGGETGFLVGSMAALLSNFAFGQGPWTPFQMLALGLIGLSAGGLKAMLKKSRGGLCLFGAAAGVAYSMVMDVWTVLWASGSLDLTLYGAALLTALPHTALYAVSGALFLWWMMRPVGEKLERVRVKYGL